MEFAWRSGESDLDRIQALQLVQANADNSRSLAEFTADRQNSAAVGGFLGAGGRGGGGSRRASRTPATEAEADFQEPGPGHGSVSDLQESKKLVTSSSASKKKKATRAGTFFC